MLRKFYATSTGEGCLNNIREVRNDNGDCNENVEANKCNQQNKHAFGTFPCHPCTPDSDVKHPNLKLNYIAKAQRSVNVLL